MNKLLDNIKISEIRTIALEMKKYEDGINFTIGEPSQDIPQDIKKYMGEVTINERICYPQTGGIPELKKAVVDFYNTRFGSEYSYDECLITVGATEGISIFTRALLDKGDEVLLPIPSYPGYYPNVILSEAKPVYVDTSKENFKLKASTLEKYITDKTKAIILTTPNNPTGQIIDKSELDGIVKLIEKYGIYVLCDEIYATIAFDKFYSMGVYKNLKDKIVVISGFSKSHSMTGYRVGYMLTSKENISNFIKLNQYTTTGVSTVSQLGAVKAIELYPERLDIIKENKEKAEYFKKGLERLGFNVINPEGAFYLFVGYSNISKKTSAEFCLDLLQKTHVGVVPGISFGVDGYFRISITTSIEKIKEALERIERYVRDINE